MDFQFCDYIEDFVPYMVIGLLWLAEAIVIFVNTIMWGMFWSVIGIVMWGLVLVPFGMILHGSD
jgi:hypothetical protein